ncbi:hypothetical protein ACIA2T_39125 [Amycolatopsis japonica]
MAAQVRIWVVTDDLGPREADTTVFVPEPRKATENDFPAEHIVLGYN